MIRRPQRNEDFVAEVKATGRKNLIMAGVTVEVYLASSNSGRSRRLQRIKEITVKPYFKGDRTWHRKQR